MYDHRRCDATFSLRTSAGIPSGRPSPVWGDDRPGLHAVSSLAGIAVEANTSQQRLRLGLGRRPANWASIELPVDRRLALSITSPYLKRRPPGLIPLKRSRTPVSLQSSRGQDRPWPCRVRSHQRGGSHKLAGAKIPDGIATVRALPADHCYCKGQRRFGGPQPQRPEPNIQDELRYGLPAPDAS